MKRLVAICKVNDLGEWKKSFRADAPIRQQLGFTKEIILHSEFDAQEVCVTCNCDDIEIAKAFIHSNELANRLISSGVVSSIKYYFE